MNSPSSRALVVDSSEPRSSDGARLATSNATRTAKRSSRRALQTAYLILPQSLETFARFSETDGPTAIEAWSMWSLRVSPAPCSRKRLEGETSQRTYGPKPQSALAVFDRDSRCWKTWTLFGTRGADSLEFLETWPRSGSMRNGECFRREDAEPPTIAPASGFWLATPTATANQAAPSMQKHPGCRAWGGRIDPESFEWAMGMPTGWTECAPLETHRFREWLSAHGPNCSGDSLEPEAA